MQEQENHLHLTYREFRSVLACMVAHLQPWNGVALCAELNCLLSSSVYSMLPVFGAVESACVAQLGQSTNSPKLQRQAQLGAAP